MAYTIEAIREAAVDPGAIFDLYTDPSSWSVWGHNVRWARSDGPLAEGGTIDIRPMYPVTYHCRVQRLVPDRLLRIEVRPVGMTIINVYEVEPTAGGSRVRHAFEMAGPLSGPLRWLGVARLYRSSLDQEIRHCVEFAQARAEAPAQGSRPMRAVVHDRYGPPEVLRLETVERPVPTDDEVLVRVHATTVNRTDAGWRSADLPITRYFTGWRRPRQRSRILGSEFAGVVEAVGGSVREFSVGDDVFGTTIFGANAEYLCVRESGAIGRKPAGMALEDAAGVLDGAILALSCLREAGPLDGLAGRRILIYGASGSIGTAAVQLAHHFGAHVTAVCGTKNLELAASLGADEVIDYQNDDFTKNGQTYDVIFDAVGKHSFRRCRRSLRPGGTFIETDPGFLFHVPLLMLATRWAGTRKVKMGIGRYGKADVNLIKELIEAGEFRPVIDRRYRLEDVVEATRYVETGEKTGNVVLTVVDSGGNSS